MSSGASCDNNATDILTELHPWQPFLPDGARVLLLGTFPPGRHRWNMEFYYPNRTNDFWYMMGLIFRSDRNALLRPNGRDFNLESILELLSTQHIALHDTARVVRRLRGNASDKHLQIVEPVDLVNMLTSIPQCHDIATTGEKAAQVVASLTSTDVPRMGESTTTFDGSLRIWRMPSTSRAYPLALEKKAVFYERMLREVGCL